MKRKLGKSIADGVAAFVLVALLSAVPTAAQQATGEQGSPSGATTIDGKQIPPPPPKFGGVINQSAATSKPLLMSIDETFDVGLDTRTPVDFTYDVPFRFTGTIDKLNYRLGPEQLSAEDKRKAAVMLAAAKD
jgi:hypothetical protein